MTYSKKIIKHIEIVGSTNPRLNAMAKDSRLSLLSTLQKRYTNVNVTIVNTMADLEMLAAKKPDLVVLGMKVVLLDPAKGYDASPKMWLSAYLEQQGIEVTGSNAAALTLEYDKQDAKQRVLDAGLRSSAYIISKVNDPVIEHNLAYPLFVKPTNRGDSRGVDEFSVVHNDAALAIKVASIHNDWASDALIEEYLPGREFSVAVTRQPHTKKLYAMPIEIKAPADKNGNTFLSEAIKDADSEQVVAVTDITLKGALNKLAIDVFQALNARDYGRIDMRLDAEGNPSFIEANLMPGLSRHGYLSRCFSINNQISYEDMVLSIVELGFERFAEPDISVPSPTILKVVPLSRRTDVELAA